MPFFDTLRKVGQDKRHETFTNTEMTETDRSETYDIPDSHGKNAESRSEASILTEEGFDEQIRTYIETFTKQLENVTRLIQGASSVYRQNFSARATTSANSSSTGPSLDMVIGCTGTLPDNRL